MQELAKLIRAAAGSGKPLDEAIRLAVAPLFASGRVKPGDDSAPKILEANGFTRDGSPIPGATSDVAAQAFALQQPGDVPADITKLDDGYAVVQLIEKTPATREAFDKDREAYSARFLAMKQHDAVVTYVLRLKEAAKAEIKVNASFLEAPAAVEEE